MYDCDIDFSGCIAPPKDIGKYKKFNISIDGLYFVGDGFRNTDDRLVWNKIKCLIEGMVPDFKGYFTKLIYLKNADGCDKIISPDLEYEPSYVYLHPENLSGILLEEHINDLCDRLNSYFKQINREDCSARILYIEDTYHLNDIDYVNLLYENSDKIIEYVQQYLNKLSPKKKESYLKFGYKHVGYDFAKTGRIERDFSNSPGYSFSDADIKTVTNIVENAINKGILK